MILSIGKPLFGRLLIFNALDMSINEVYPQKDPNCPVCGENPSIHELIDYEEFCGLPLGREEVPGEELDDEYLITPIELQEDLARGRRLYLIDVREPHEWDICHLPQANFIPERNLPARMHELDSSKEIVLYCRTGFRSARALKLLREAGFDKIKNLVGGIHRWADDVDTSMPKY